MRILLLSGKKYDKRFFVLGFVAEEPKVSKTPMNISLFTQMNAEYILNADIWQFVAREIFNVDIFFKTQNRILNMSVCIFYMRYFVVRNNYCKHISWPKC